MIVVTPGSGRGHAQRTGRRIRRLLTHRGRDATLRVFDRLEALVRWAGACEPTFSRLVCVGGDGTLSAAAVAAIRCHAPLAPVPNGFGNVFARVFGHPGHAERVVDLLEHGEIRMVDVGVAGRDEIFLSHRSYGPLEQIQQLSEQRSRPRSRLLRLLGYVGTAYRFFQRARLPAIGVEVDGVVVAKDATLVTVANVETYRGFLALTPAASPIDGMFDVFVVPRTGRAGLAWRLVRLLLRLPGRWRGVRLYRGRHVVVTTPVRREALTVRRRALPLLVPPGAIQALMQRTVEGVAPVERPS